MRGVCLLVSAVFACATPAVAGSLTPPGAPAPTMKSLDQVEPRVPIGPLTTPGDADSVYKITQPGSYYLTGNLFGSSGKYGIEIATGNVTVDLGGFLVSGGSGSLDGVRASTTFPNLVVHSGTVIGWSGDGVDLSLSSVSLVRDVISRLNGGYGIFVGGQSEVRDCTVATCSLDGIRAEGRSVITDCVASYNNGDGIDPESRSVVTACVASNNNGYGIRGGAYNTIVDCTASSNGVDGISGGIACTIRNNTAGDNGAYGVRVSSGSIVRLNTCAGNGRTTVAGGIAATGSDNRIELNHCTGSDYGIIAFSGGNGIFGNTASGNSAASWNFAAGNFFGALVDREFAATAGYAGDGGINSTLGTTDPYANVTY
ncbi:MAG: right-handed parallel beta-helix repeat-containing protein [Phycisphaerales bacterium]